MFKVFCLFLAGLICWAVLTTRGRTTVQNMRSEVFTRIGSETFCDFAEIEWKVIFMEFPFVWSALEVVAQWKQAQQKMEYLWVAGCFASDQCTLAPPVVPC